MAMRSLVDWNRIPKDHMHSVLAKIAPQLCASVGQVFSVLYNNNQLRVLVGEMTKIMLKDAISLAIVDILLLLLDSYEYYSGPFGRF